MIIPGINWLSAAAGAVVAAVVMFGGMSAYSALVTVPRTKAETRALVTAESREAAFKLIEKRTEDNAEINAFDMRQLCSELGGVWLPDPENRCD
jgi:hypothetical protein